MSPYTPRVKEAHAFKEISLDFTTPAEIFREAIANSLDAYARRIWLRISVEQRRGRETVLIDICDDGMGMNESGVHAFLNLSDSVKSTTPPSGQSTRRMSGYKGHGTKIYYNSEEVEVITYNGKDRPVYCRLKDPRGELADGRLPTAEIEEISLDTLKLRRDTFGFPDLGAGTGTLIRVLAYHQNIKNGLEHVRLRDYVCWFTRWGSWEPKLCAVAKISRREVDDLGSCELFLRGLGKEPDPAEYDKIPFGHPFPAEDETDIRKLRVKDDSDPLKFYIRTWAFPNEPLIKNPEKRIDFIFAIEGEGARREYNNMLRRRGKERRPGDYLSEERYGLWLGCDFVPVERFNSWVAERSEYTRMHAFVNSEDLDLTANRGSVENTPAELLKDIEDTIRMIFRERIESNSDYVKFQDEMLAIERHRHATREADDYRRRLKRLEAKEIAKVNGSEFYSPITETDLIALTASIQTVLPDLFAFVVRDYDSHFGFDGLATRNKTLAINETQHLFVEFKVDLKKDFNHTFERLEAIICWTSRVKDGEEVTDLAGKRGTYHISTRQEGGKARFIVIPDSPRNVEVILLKELLEQRNVRFRPVGE